MPTSSESPLLLSIIIPVYNVSNYIGECLDSIFSQQILSNKTDFLEVIAINDGSTDDSLQILERYQKSYQNLSVTSQTNQGASVARNTGVAKSRGKYIWYVDSDDKLLPDALERVYDLIAKFPEIPLFSSPLVLFPTKNGELDSYNDYNELTYKEYFNGKYPYAAIPRYIIKRELLEENNLEFEPEIIFEDDLFGIKLIYCAKMVKFVEPLYMYRIGREGSVMNTLSFKKANSYITIHKRLIEFCNEKVAKKDKIYFKKLIFHEIDYIFPVLYDGINTPDADEFFANHSEYIRKQALFLLSTKRCLEALFIIASPKIYYKNIRGPITVLKRKIAWKLHHR